MRRHRSNAVGPLIAHGITKVNTGVMGKRPAIQFYPGDWLRDSVSGCSLAAQGLWLRMMIIGHDSERYGYLLQNGKPIPPESIARRCGCTPEQYLALLDELDNAGVISRTADGTIFSRRMVRDEQERLGTRKRVEKHRSNGRCNASVTPKYEEEVEEEKEPPVIEVVFDLQGFDFPEFYEKLQQIYPKRRRSALIEQFAMIAVEKTCQLHSFRRSEAASYILKRTRMYVEMVPVQFQEKFDNFLRDLVFDQDPAAWERKEPAKSGPDMAIGARRDGPWTQEEYDQLNGGEA